jgi:hypothetical protein
MSSWTYEDVAFSRSGTMNCIRCNKKITSGEYRCRQKSKHHDWHYQTEHRECSSDDKQWAIIDEQKAANNKRQIELSNACREFKDKWGVTELDDYIIGATP